MKLPTWEESKLAVEDGTATELQRFIFENEPAGEKDEIIFRDRLAKVMKQLAATHD